MIKKIVVIGPESTGKSTLCEQLAAHYKTAWVKEYAREYLNNKTGNYRYEDLYCIAQGQIKNEVAAIELMQSEDALNKKNAPLFIDTDMYVIKVWSEFVFNKTDNRLLKMIAERKYDFYLLCNVDLPWVKDDLREYPDLVTRTKLLHYYKDAMINQPLPWQLISGNYEERLSLAIKTIDNFLP